MGSRKSMGTNINVYLAWWFFVVFDVAMINPIKPNIGLWISLNMNQRYSLQRHLNATVDAITHVYCYVAFSVLTMQLPQHWTCKTKRYFPYTIVPTPYERKQLHESEYNSHESEMVPTTNSILTQRQVGCSRPTSFVTMILLQNT